MNVQCPKCSTPIVAANMSLDTGWGKCDACHDLFALADVVPGFPAPGSITSAPIERPFNARAMVERTRDKLLVHLPAEGLRASTLGLLGFATFWLGFIAFWTLGAMGVFFGQGAPADFAFASFSIPFWLVGFGMLGGVAWKVWGTRSMRIDQNGLSTNLRCLFWSRSRSIDRENVQHARHYDPKVQSSGQSSNAVEVVYRNGSFVLPVDSEDEELWLIGEINGFLKAQSP